MESLVGKRFNRLKVIAKTKEHDSQGNVLWKCRCDCGGEKLVSRVHLRRGQVKSCGCAFAEQAALSMKTHRQTQEELKIANRRIAELEAEVLRLQAGGMGEAERAKYEKRIAELEEELGWHQFAM